MLRKSEDTASWYFSQDAVAFSRLNGQWWHSLVILARGRWRQGGQEIQGQPQPRRGFEVSLICLRSFLKTKQHHNQNTKPKSKRKENDSALSRTGFTIKWRFTSQTYTETSWRRPADWDMVGLGWDRRFCISKQFPDDEYEAGTHSSHPRFAA